jgi:hypothetical protein
VEGAVLGWAGREQDAVVEGAALGGAGWEEDAAVEGAALGWAGREEDAAVEQAALGGDVWRFCRIRTGGYLCEDLGWRTAECRGRVRSFGSGHCTWQYLSNRTRWGIMANASIGA